MGIESIVNAVINAARQGLTRAGFSTPLILSTTVRSGTDLIRYYKSPLGVVVDYPADTPEYKMAARVFSQDKRPSQVAIGKRSTKPIQSFTLTPKAANSALYSVLIDGVTVSFTSDASGTQAEVATGLLAAYAAVEAGPEMTAASAGSGTAVKLTSDTAGVWHQVKVLTPDTLSIVQDQGDVGVAGDLTTLLLAKNDWYGVLTAFPSQAEVMAIAAWTETNRKQFFYATVDSAVTDTVYNDETPDNDVGGALLSRGYARSLGLFQRSTDDFTDAAAMGRFYGEEPGKIVLHLRSLVGPQPTTLTEPQEKNLTDRRINPYLAYSGASVVLNGWMAAPGVFADQVRDRDNYVRRVQEDVFIELQKNDKPPYTDEGVLIIKNVASARTELEERRGYIAPGTWTVTALPVADVDPADLEARRYPGVEIAFREAGAIQTVNPLTITILTA